MEPDLDKVVTETVELKEARDGCADGRSGTLAGGRSLPTTGPSMDCEPDGRSGTPPYAGAAGDGRNEIPSYGGRRVRPGPGAEELIGALAELYERRGRQPMTLREFERLSGFTHLQVRRVFDGGWTELRGRAGMPQHPAAPRRYDEEVLMGEFHRIAVEVGRIPRWIDFDRHGRISSQPYMSRFGGKAGLVRRYREWLEEREPESPLLALCDDTGDGRRVRRNRRCRRGRVESGTVLGEPISHRSLQYAPTNELGVVFLFGLLCDELGFAVQRMGSAFPDCEAARAVDAARTRWERVRIEFEHRSRNFLEHGHDPEECDLVVCWRHDWAECPVEVLELSSVVRG